MQAPIQSEENTRKFKSDIKELFGRQQALILQYQETVGQLVGQMKNSRVFKALESLGGTKFEASALAGELASLEAQYSKCMESARAQAQAVAEGKLDFGANTQTQEQNQKAYMLNLTATVEAAKNALFCQLDFLIPYTTKGEKVPITGSEATGHEAVEYLVDMVHKAGSDKTKQAELYKTLSEFFQWKANLAHDEATKAYEENGGYLDKTELDKVRKWLEPALASAKTVPHESEASKLFQTLGQKTNAIGKSGISSISGAKPSEQGQSAEKWVEECMGKLQRLHEAKSGFLSKLSEKIEDEEKKKKFVETRFFGTVSEYRRDKTKKWAGLLGDVGFFGMGATSG
ncbi:hypothetical protein FJZ26_06270, partial [Candidatus Parvarchaeota archaeon]|nr:hypothetical protein [Candidatus Parvarchaeota archaeon]